MKRRDQLVSPKQAKGSEVVVEGGYFDLLGAGDESDDHESLGEALFESDAEFSEEENVEEAIKQREDQEANQDEPQDEHVKDKPVAKGIIRPTTATKQQLEKHVLEGHANYLAGCDYCV